MTPVYGRNDPISIFHQYPGAKNSGGSTSSGFLSRARTRITGPEFVTDLMQILKTVIAGTLAWWLSKYLFNSSLPFLAPWTAILTVHATVYRSMMRGIGTIVSSVAGVVLSYAIGEYLGVSVWTMAGALLIGLCASRLKWLRDEGLAIATTAVFVLGSGFSSQEPLLFDRIEEIAIGVAIGVIVNLMIIPPVRDRQAAHYVDSINRRLGNVMADMADELTSSWDTSQADAWVRETNSMDDELNSARGSVRFARESSQLNPRTRLVSKRTGRPGADDDQSRVKVGYEEILERVAEGISHLRNLVRTTREATYAEGAWDTEFRETWTQILRDAGEGVRDPDADVEPIYRRLDRLASRMSEADDLPSKGWPVYGSLITSLRHIATIVDDVASAREARDADAENPDRETTDHEEAV